MARTTGKPTTLLSVSKYDFVQRNINNIYALRSWALWYPDLFLDLLKPSTGGLRLHLDQRVAMRCDARFFAYYGCFPRGASKTLNQILVGSVECIIYPGLELAISAQTKDNAIALVIDKINEAMKWYPILANEIAKIKQSKVDVEITFKNTSRITVLANSQSSKGMRRTRLRIEEASPAFAAFSYNSMPLSTSFSTPYP